MKNVIFTLVFLFSFSTSFSQEILYKSTYISETNQIEIHLDLNEASLIVPGYEFLGPMSGYICGKGVYGTWFLTSHKNEGMNLILRFSNDTGSDSQTIRLIPKDCSNVHYETIGNNCIRKTQGRKLIKIDDVMDLHLVEKVCTNIKQL